MGVIQSYLLEGSLCSRIEARRALVERMAETLIAIPEGLFSENDAVRILFNQGYGITDSVILAGAARTEAHQMIVAREMSDLAPEEWNKWTARGAFSGAPKVSKP